MFTGNITYPAMLCSSDKNGLPCMAFINLFAVMCNRCVILAIKCDIFNATSGNSRLSIFFQYSRSISRVQGLSHRSIKIHPVATNRSHHSCPAHRISFFCPLDCRRTGLRTPIVRDAVHADISKPLLSRRPVNAHLVSRREQPRIEDFYAQLSQRHIIINNRRTYPI